MSLEVKYLEFLDKITEAISDLVQSKGKEDSKHYSDKVLKPDDDFMFNLDVGHPSGSYVTEVKKEGLVSNYGHVYSFDSLETQELCQLIDHLQIKYS